VTGTQLPAQGQMKISIIGWGSLVWNGQNLALAGQFEPIGPRLPIEFCRVSRNECLTLVIDETLGAPCITYSAVSHFSTLDSAIENLRVREGMPTRKGIGFIGPNGRQSDAAIERHPQAVRDINAWINTSGFDAAIWTALGSNFEEKTREPFSVEAAIRYLEARNKQTLRRALGYIREAPPEISTPVRQSVNFRWPVQ